LREQIFYILLYVKRLKVSGNAENICRLRFLYMVLWSISEIKICLDTLTEAKWIKLGKTANNLCVGLPFEGADLLHIVVCKALEGKRKCRKYLPIEVFIYGAMESLVDAFIKKRKSDPLQLTRHISEENDVTELIDLFSNNIDTPEEELIASQALQRIEQLFEGDENSLKILSYQMDNLTPADIQELMQLTSVQYASALRAIRRKYEKLEI